MDVGPMDLGADLAAPHRGCAGFARASVWGETSLDRRQLDSRATPPQTSGMDGKQIYPESITGKGSRFAPGGSVLDHRFGKSDPYTLGVEEEYMLLDAEGFDLVQHIDTVLAAIAGGEFEARINPELMQSTTEITTPVCRPPAEVAAELRKLRTYVGGIAREQGL